MKVALFAVLLLLSACTTGMSEEEIKTAVIEANSGINSYKVEVDMDITSESQGQNIEMVMGMAGSVDRAAKKAAMTSIISMNIMGFDQSIESETYVDGDNLYTQLMGQWVKTEGENFWEDQDQADQYTDLIQNGDLDVKGTETIEGTEYYVVELS
jgi:outer membrane lipoprotein-sorting protein